MYKHSEENYPYSELKESEVKFGESEVNIFYVLEIQLFYNFSLAGSLSYPGKEPIYHMMQSGV